MDEYNHLIALRERLFNANSMLFLAVLVWWIITLWFDEPGTVQAAAPAGPVAEGEAETAATEPGVVEVVNGSEKEDAE
jgi:hypothetical protein